MSRTFLAQFDQFLVNDSHFICPDSDYRSRGRFYSRHKPRNLHITAICSAIIHFQSNHAVRALFKAVQVGQPQTALSMEIHPSS